MNIGAPNSFGPGSPQGMFAPPSPYGQPPVPQGPAPQGIFDPMVMQMGGPPGFAPQGPAMGPPAMLPGFPPPPPAGYPQPQFLPQPQGANDLAGAPMDMYGVPSPYAPPAGIPQAPGYPQAPGGFPGGNPYLPQMNYLA